jgi:hypothetical protein
LSQRDQRAVARDCFDRKLDAGERAHVGHVAPAVRRLQPRCNRRRGHATIARIGEHGRERRLELVRLGDGIEVDGRHRRPRLVPDLRAHASRVGQHHRERDDG